MTGYELLRWLHFVGFTSWLAGLVAMGLLLRAGAAARPAAFIADIGSTLTIVSGVYRAVTGGFFSQPYIHIKLLFVAALLGVHAAMRVRVRKQDGARAGAMVVVVGVLAALIIYTIEFRPFAR
jgi:uncharacterized membrane protein